MSGGHKAAGRLQKQGLPKLTEGPVYQNNFFLLLIASSSDSILLWFLSVTTNNRQIKLFFTFLESWCTILMTHDMILSFIAISIPLFLNEYQSIQNTDMYLRQGTGRHEEKQSASQLYTISGG